MAVIDDGLLRLAGQCLFGVLQTSLMCCRCRSVLVFLASVAFGGQAVPASIITVDWQNSGLQDGTEAHPYRTVAQALNAVGRGDTIAIRTGHYNFQGAFNKPGIVRAENGPVDIAGSSTA